MYAKYSIAGLRDRARAVGLLLTGHAKLLRSRRLALGVALAVVLLLPNAIWQIAHGLPMLEVLHNDQLNRHALANGMADESPQPVDQRALHVRPAVRVQQSALRAGMDLGTGVAVA